MEYRGHIIKIKEPSTLSEDYFDIYVDGKLMCHKHKDLLLKDILG